MVWFNSFHDFRELFLDFLDHIVSSSSDGSHGESGESIGDHSSEEESREGVGVEDVNGDVFSTFSLLEFFNTGDEGTEESEGNKASGSNSETLTNSGGGVTCSVELISEFTDIFMAV